MEGRDYFGQVTVDIGGTSYILLGDRQQLDAINASDAGGIRVCGPVFRVTQRRRYLVDWDADNLVEERVELIYPGDADLLPGVFNGSGLSDFSDRPLYASPDSGYPELTTEVKTTGYERSFICTVDPDTGRWSMEQRSPGTLRYTKNGHYIVFRDIDMNVGALNGSEWRPLMFSGTMLGVKAADPAELAGNGRGDPTALATGAFAGRIRGRITVTDCLVEDFTVTRASVLRTVDRFRVTGRGGVVGCVHAAGYDAPTVRNCGVSASAERFRTRFAGAVWVSDPWALPSLRGIGALD